jgi:glucosyltransferase
MDKLSIIVPCYNEQETLPYLYYALKKISSEMEEQEFEFILINDGSKDNTLDLIIEIANMDSRIKYISFSRNFGKEAAMYAGLENASGDYIAVIDADMQDPPSMIPEMYHSIITEGYDCVAARRTNRDGEPHIRSFCAKIFYKLINKISNLSIVEGARDFRLMTRQMVNAIISMGEYNRFSKGIFDWVGFETKWIDYNRTERVAGKSKWSFWKLLIYAIEGIVDFSTKPLAIASLSGLIFCIIAFILICVIIIKTLIFGDAVSGWPSLICIICLIGGVQLFCTGILGQYLARAYLEIKQRPVYIIKKSNAEGWDLNNGFERKDI